MVPLAGRVLVLLALLAASAGAVLGFATGRRPNVEGLDPLGMLASGSLLVAADPAAVERLISISTDHDFPLTGIGEVTGMPGRFTLREDGVERELPLYESER